jgi:hypothetical protein
VLPIAATILGAPVGARAEWTTPRRVTPVDGSRLDSLHQLAGSDGRLHLVHPRRRPGPSEDLVVYQRSLDGGSTWTAERIVFRATRRHRRVIPNLAVAARNELVALAWRAAGPRGTTLFVRVSRDGGRTFDPRQPLARSGRGIGVPAVAVGAGTFSVAWTDRADGAILMRRSGDGGRHFGGARRMASTRLSIDCGGRVLDGLVGLVAAGERVHLAWSHARHRRCIAAALRARSSSDEGRTWSRTRTLTSRDSFGWPELAATRRTVLAAAQLPSGGLLVARSSHAGRRWSERVVRPGAGRSLSAGDVAVRRRGVAWLTYVVERYEGDALASTRVVVRRSGDAGRHFGRARTLAPNAARLRLAPNVAMAEGGPAIVFQAGALDGRPRDLLVTRRR